MGWKILFALVLVLLIVWFVTYDDRNKKQLVEWKDRAANMMQSMNTTVPTGQTVQTVPSEQPAAKKEGFCPKLGQKYGFCNAGAQ